MSAQRKRTEAIRTTLWGAAAVFERGQLDDLISAEPVGGFTVCNDEALGDAGMGWFAATGATRSHLRKCRHRWEAAKPMGGFGGTSAVLGQAKISLGAC